MKIIFQHSSALDPAIVAQITAKLPGQLRPISSQCIAFEHTLISPQQHQEIQAQAHNHKVDVAFLERDLFWSDFKLLAMDMDSTVINIECIDEIADMCGKKAEVSAITEAAMRGEITDFNQSLSMRLALLAGVPATVLDQILSERLQLNPGAEQLIEYAHTKGLETLLVSGGFTFFTHALQRRLNLTHTRANELEIINDTLTGHVLGSIVNGQVKADTVQAHCDRLNVPSSAAICMGDGANDLPMMAISGLSVAYHAKPKVQEKAMVAINQLGLDGLIALLN